MGGGTQGTEGRNEDPGLFGSPTSGLSSDPFCMVPMMIQLK